MAGTVTFTKENVQYRKPHQQAQLVTINWLSDVSGNASILIPDIRGFIVSALTKPGAATPVDLYGIELFHSVFTTLDVLEGALLSRSATLQQRVPQANSGINSICHVHGGYTFSVKAAGANKDGVCLFEIVTP